MLPSGAMAMSTLLGRPVEPRVDDALGRPATRPGWVAAAFVPCLVVVFGVTAGLRLWGINYGLPDLYHVDEPFIVNVAWQMYRSGDLNPKFWDYPSLQIYSILVLISLREWLVPYVPFLNQPAQEYLLGRLMNAAYSIATVVLVYRIGAGWFGRWSGLVAAALLGFAEQHNLMSHYLKVDIPTTFFTTATLAAVVRLVERPGAASYLLAGAAVGLSGAAKYPAASVALLVPVAHLLAWRGGSLRQAWRLLLAGGAAIGSFAAACPYTVIDLAGFVTTFDSSIVAWAATGHDGWEGAVLRSYLTWLFWGYDAPLSWLAVLGIGVGALRRDRRVLLVAVFPIVFFIELTGFWQVRFPWYVLPMYPYLAILGGYGALAAGAWLLARRPALAAALAAIVLAGLLVQLSGAFERSWSLASEDARTTTRSWIVANLPPGSRIVREGYTPALPEDRFRVTEVWRAIDKPLTWYADERVDYVVLSNFMNQRYFDDPARYARQVADYRALMARGERVARIEGPMLGTWVGALEIYRLRQ